MNDLIFDPNTGKFSVDPSMSFEEMEYIILNDDDDDSKEIGSHGTNAQISQFGSLICKMEKILKKPKRMFKKRNKIE